MTEQEFAVKFARLVLKAQDIREESLNPDAGIYNKSQEECAKEACRILDCSHIMIHLIAMLNDQCWNDVQWWSREVQKNAN